MPRTQAEAAATLDPPVVPHALDGVRVCEALGVDPQRGLRSEDARARLARFGDNALPVVPGPSLLWVFLRQLKSPLINLLLLAAALAFALGHTSDALVIVAVVLLNALIGALQEGRAQRSLEALQRLTPRSCRVLRDGSEQVLDARQLVPGDMVSLAAGDAVPADARLFEVAALRVSEAALTGESLPLDKHTGPLPEATALPDRANMVYSGTYATAGRARAVVVATGARTEIGAVAALAEKSHARAAQTPLEQRVRVFGRTVAIAALIVSLAIVALGVLRGIRFVEIFMVAVSQLVGMVPEGLPVAMTIALAIGVQRMAARRAVVRRLSAVETLGSVTVICTDKTGTLTRNEMTVTAVVLADGRELRVSGSGYARQGAIERIDEQAQAGLGAAEPGLRALIEAAVLCNDAVLQQPESSAQAEPQAEALGDPTEIALLVLAHKAGIEPEAVRAAQPRNAELPFDAVTKRMATEHRSSEGSFVIVKGAPEVVLALCDDAEPRARMQARADALAARALRVLAFARIDGAQVLQEAGELTALGGRVTLLGLVGQIDPPRPEARAAIEQCRRAGIRPVMITGDHAATARAIAGSLGMVDEGDETLEGQELERMSDAELRARLARISVFARVQPAQKLRIVTAYQQNHHVVAMTGDGVNDAPALAAADVGVAMGKSGTDVAKEAAKVVIMDDDFATIVTAVEQGRVVYQNIKKVVLFLFATSAAEVLILLIALAFGFQPPFTALQILWNNLVTEGVIVIYLVMEPREGHEMQRPPIQKDEPLLHRALLVRMAFMTPAIVTSALGWFLWRTSLGIEHVQVQTETFTLLAICEWYNVLNCRSDRSSALSTSVLKNPWLVTGLLVGNALQLLVVYFAPLARLFHTVPFGLREALALGVVGSLVLWVEEARKWLVRRRSVIPGDPPTVNAS